MLAQTDFGPTIEALTAALVLAGPVAVVVTKVVDFVRDAIDKPDKLPKWVWVLLALVLGVVIALGWDINLMKALVETVPKLSDSGFLSGTGGVILTGLLVGAMASFWHEKLSAWSAQSGVTVPKPNAPT